MHHLLKFSVRRRAASRPAHAVKLLTPLGCQFEEGYFHNEVPAWKASILGMDVFFYEWRGHRNTRIYRLHGTPNNLTYSKLAKGKNADFALLDISSAVVDLLNSRNDEVWYVPSEKDVEAEAAYGEQIAGHQQ